MASEVMLAWTRRGPVYHVAAGHKWRTACGAEIWPARVGHSGWWITGTEAPTGRRLCRRCRQMAADVSADRMEDHSGEPVD